MNKRLLVNGYSRTPRQSHLISCRLKIYCLMMSECGKALIMIPLTSIPLQGHPWLSTEIRDSHGYSWLSMAGCSMDTHSSCMETQGLSLSVGPCQGNSGELLGQSKIILEMMLDDYLNGFVICFIILASFGQCPLSKNIPTQRCLSDLKNRPL